MFLKTLPLVFVLAGLVLYTVLAGADFGAGMWRLLAGTGERGERIRDHAHHSMGPVWEANHVWLIFVITVAWTAYPVFLGSVASTLAVPFFIAALGIILRGASYALRSAASTSRESRMVDSAFAVASLVTPFALGTMAGAIAAERVPVGNAAGGLFSSWTAPVPILIGVLAVAFSAYLAAVYLAADAARHGDPELEEAYRVRALGAGAAAGALAIVGLVVLHADAHSLYTGLLHGAALAVLIVSLLAGTAALGLVATRRFEPARYVAALAVAAVVAGWAFARYPVLLPGLTVEPGGRPARHAGRGGGRRAGRRGDPVPVAGAAVRAPAARAAGRPCAARGAEAGAAVPGAAAGAAGPRRARRRCRHGWRWRCSSSGVGLPQRRRRRLGARDRRLRPVRLHDRRVRRDRPARGGRGSRRAHPARERRV